jgi:hypothetical protein
MTFRKLTGMARVHAIFGCALLGACVASTKEKSGGLKRQTRRRSRSQARL